MTDASRDDVREIGRVRGDGAGPALVVVAALHGNEPAGVAAARRVLERIAAERVPLRGDLTCVVGNAGALAKGVRCETRDLNRSWTSDRMKALAAGRFAPRDAEDRELAALHAAIAAARAAARGPVSILDLHTTSGDGAPFTIATGDAASRALGRAVPLTCLTGLLEKLDGTMLMAYAHLGVPGLVAECGQHADPASADRAEAAAWLVLEACGLVDAAHAPWLAPMRTLLESARGALPRRIEVVHRHAIAAGDGFVMAPGFRHFDRVEKGRALAHDVRGDVAAPLSGWLLMPLYQASGDDGFFVGR
jgi:succinylglutamate desuccinylase